MKCKFFFTPYVWLATYCREHATYNRINTFHSTNWSDELNLHKEVSDSLNETQKYYFIDIHSAFLAWHFSCEYFWKRNSKPTDFWETASWGLSNVSLKTPITPVSNSCKSQNSSFPPHGFTQMDFFFFFKGITCCTVEKDWKITET